LNAVPVCIQMLLGPDVLWKHCRCYC